MSPNKPWSLHFHLFLNETLLPWDGQWRCFKCSQTLEGATLHTFSNYHSTQRFICHILGKGLEVQCYAMYTITLWEITMFGLSNSFTMPYLMPCMFWKCLKHDSVTPKIGWFADITSQPYTACVTKQTLEPSLSSLFEWESATLGWWMKMYVPKP